MARDVATSDTPSKDHNSQIRRERINAVIHDLQALIAERDGVSAEITELKNKVIKGELGFKMADFNAIYRLALLEVKDRDQYLDTMREMWLALGLGEQLDWLGTGKQPESVAKAAKERAEKAHKQGYEDGKSGKARNNKNPIGTEDFDQYEWGYATAQKENLDGVGKGDGQHASA